MRKLNIFRFALCLVFMMCVFSTVSLSALADSEFARYDFYGKASGGNWAYKPFYYSLTLDEGSFDGSVGYESQHFSDSIVMSSITSFSHPGTYVFEFSGYSFSFSVSEYVDAANFSLTASDKDYAIYCVIGGERYVINEYGGTVITYEHTSDEPVSLSVVVDYSFSGDAMYTLDFERVSVPVKVVLNYDDINFTGYCLTNGSEFPLAVQAVDLLSDINGSILESGETINTTLLDINSGITYTNQLLEDANGTLNDIYGSQENANKLLEESNDHLEESNNLQEDTISTLEQGNSIALTGNDLLRRLIALKEESNALQQGIVDDANESFKDSGYRASNSTHYLERSQDALIGDGFDDLELYAVDFVDFSVLGNGFISAFAWVSYMLENLFTLTEFSAVIPVVYCLLVAVVLLGLRRLWR